METIKQTFIGVKLVNINASTFAKYGVPITLHVQNSHLFLLFENDDDHKNYVKRLENIKIDLLNCGLDQTNPTIQETIDFINLIILKLSF